MNRRQDKRTAEDIAASVSGVQDVHNQIKVQEREKNQGKEQQGQQTTVSPVPGKHADADFKVSGIAWQKESVSRLAVVNGTPVVQGAVVEGARVEEIFQDRVRFSRDNSSFEVPLGKVSTER